MVTEKRIFERIDVATVADAVVSQIEQLIVSGVLKSGQRLPSEAELADLTGVSRPKVREAIKTLEDRGLLAVRHGDGTFVANLNGPALSPPVIDLFSRHPQAFRDYLEFRCEVEGYAAFLAAQRATEADRAIIRAHIAAMDAAHASPDAAEEARIDAHFHLAIVDAAHNAMLSHVMASVYELMMRNVFYNRSLLFRVTDARNALLAQHHAIADAVLEGRADDACAAAEDHMRFVQRSHEVESTHALRDTISRKRLMLMQQAAGLGEGKRPRRRRGEA